MILSSAFVNGVDSLPLHAEGCRLCSYAAEVLLTGRNLKIRNFLSFGVLDLYVDDLVVVLDPPICMVSLGD